MGNPSFTKMSLTKSNKQYQWRTEARGAAQWYNVLGTLGALESIPSTKRKEIRKGEGKKKSEVGEKIRRNRKIGYMFSSAKTGNLKNQY